LEKQIFCIMMIHTSWGLLQKEMDAINLEEIRKVFTSFQHLPWLLPQLLLQFRPAPSPDH
jgi:hypothetical protein